MLRCLSFTNPSWDKFTDYCPVISTYKAINLLVDDCSHPANKEKLESAHQCSAARTVTISIPFLGNLAIAL